MPTYEFTCPKGHDFEKFFRSMASAPTVVPCPVCGEPADRQVSAGAGLVFHGSGFYITDYGKDGKKDQKPPGLRTVDASKGSSADPSPGASGGSESKSSDKGSDAGTSGTSATESKSSSDGAAKDSASPSKTPPPAKAAE